MSNPGDFFIQDGILKQYRGPGGDVVIPDGVTSIGNNAFKDCVSVTSITLPESVKNVQGSPFKGCKGLADEDGFVIIKGILFDYFGPGGDVSIPEGIKIITGSAFNRNEQLTGITLPDSLKRIHPAAFKGCKGLADSDGFVIVHGTLFDYIGPDENVVIPDGVICISGGVFDARSNVNSVCIPESVTKIDFRAFAGSQLTSVTIPRSLKEVGKEAFLNCRALNAVYICDLAAWCSIQFDESSSNPLALPFIKHPNLFLNGALLTSLDFSGSDIPSVVANLPNCESLTSAVIPDGVKTIGNGAFEKCSNLTTVTIPESVTTIGDRAFYNCTNLFRVKIPSSVTSIGTDAFKGSKALANTEGFTVLNGVLTEYCGPGGDILIPAEVTSIGDSAFSGCSELTGVIIPEGVTAIGNDAFQRCSNLKCVTIPESVTSIGDETFDGCRELTGVIIPEGVTSIGNSAFSACSKLTGVIIPESVTSIGDSAFWYCKNLESVSIPAGVTFLGNSAFWSCDSLTSITIPGSVTSIGESTFSSCENLRDVTICEGVTRIGEKAFNYCKKLLTLTLPSTLELVEDQAFWGCDAIKEVHIQDLAAWCRIRFLGNQSNPLGVDYMHRPALLLNGNPVTEVIFSTGSLGPVMANLCYVKTLQKVTIPEGTTRISENAFEGCENLQSVIIPESVTSIGDSAFSGCKKLKSLTLPESLREIGRHAFWNCESLTNIAVPNSVSKLGREAFGSCRSLKTVVLPEKLEKIGSFVFANCPNLKDCNVPASINSWDDTPAAYKDGAYYTELDGKKEILEVFVPGQEEYSVPTWASKIRENALIGTTPKQITVSAGTVLDENVFGAFLFARNSPALTGSFLETRAELPTYYIQYFGKALKTPELLAVRLLYQSGKQWNENLTNAAQTADKAAIVEAMARVLEEEGGEKLAARFADTVLDYLEELGAEEMKASYTALRKGGFKALRKLVLDEGFQDKWLKLISTAGETEAAEKNPVEALVNEHWKTTEATKKLRTAIKEGVCYKGTDTLCPPNVVAFLVSEYARQLVNPERLPIGGYQSDYAKGFHTSALADQVAAALDTEQLRGKLEDLAYMDKTFRNGFVLALAKYGSGKQISHLCSVMRERANWGMYGVGGRQDVVIARGALLLSETREAMMALDKTGTLDVYARMRGTDAETIRDTVLADFGFDREGKKTYDLGGNQLSVSMNLDLTLRLYDENAKKSVKSVPKKNADPALYEAAKADVSDLKKNIKRVITHRRDSVFEDFLSGTGRDAVKWKKIYLGNPVLRALARLIVWEQESKTFTLSDDGAVDCAENAFTIKDSPAIRVAHPLEMDRDLIAAWQSYFMSRNLKQPFEQVWEPVYDPAEIKTDRYSGAVLPIYRFAGKDKHGIHSFGLEAYSEDFGFELDDCDVDYEPSVWRIIPGETDDETYTLSDFRLDKLTRRSNHIIFVLDKRTILDRIEKDDSSISALLPTFTLAQLTEFIRLANEKGNSNCLAVLMDYKNKNFETADPFAEFTLD